MFYRKDWIQKLKEVPYLDPRLGYALELSTYLQFPWVFGKQPKTKFVIYGTGRSGTTLLVSLLRNQPAIYCDNEIFHRRVVSPMTFLESRALLSRKEVYGFKLLTYQFGRTLKVEGPEFMNGLLCKGYKLIYLTRENVLRQAISNMYARERKQFHQVKAEKSSSKFALDIDTLDNWIQGLRRQREREARMLENLEHLELNYEKDLFDPTSHQATLEKLSTLLGVPIAAPQTNLQKIVPNELSKFIENYQDLRKYAREHQIEHLIDH